MFTCYLIFYSDQGIIQKTEELRFESYKALVNVQLVCPLSFCLDKDAPAVLDVWSVLTALDNFTDGLHQFPQLAHGDCGFDTLQTLQRA